MNNNVVIRSLSCICAPAVKSLYRFYRSVNPKCIQCKCKCNILDQNFSMRFRLTVHILPLLPYMYIGMVDKQQAN